jgi:hypothetical protein
MGTLGAAAALLAVLYVRAGAQADTSTIWQKQMLAEITRLRADFAGFVAEDHKERLEALARELHRVRGDQKRLREQERDRAEQVAAIEQQLASPDLEPDARPQIEAARAQLAGEAVEKLRAENAMLIERENELTRKLDRETLRSRRLQQEAETLAASLRKQ